jgi:membrane-bound serine protease (ClpP class)
MLTTRRIVRGLVLLAWLAALGPGLGAQDLPAPASAPTDTPPVSVPKRGLAGVFTAGGRVAIVPLTGEIDEFQYVSLKYRINKALAAGADLIVVELNTPGGRLDSALEISRMLKNLSRPTLAWVNFKAYSGGALVAAACQQIVMAPSSVVGDCAPIQFDWTGKLVPLPPTERAKALSPLLTEFRDSAEKNQPGSYALFRAMCELGITVYEVQPSAGATGGGGGGSAFVDQADQRVMVAGDTPEQAEQATNLGPTPGVEKERGRWTVVRKVYDNPDQLLTLTQSEARADGLALDDTVSNQDELRQKLDARQVVRYEQTALEHWAYWLTLDWVRAILVMALMIGIYVELHAPGLSVAGAVAALALLGLFGPPYLLGLAELWHIILFFVGLGLLIVEVFFTPGTAVPGILGVVCMFIGLVLAVVPSSSGGMGLPTAAGLGRLQWSVVSMLGGVIGGAAAFYFLSQYLGEVPLFQRLVLKTAGPRDPAGQEVSGNEVLGGGRIAPGMTGQVTTGLRPSGRAQIAGRLVDVVSQGEWIEVGRAVRVLEVQGNRIVVAEASNGPRATQDPGA